MPMAVPGDPVENERVLKRMAEGAAAYHAARTAKAAPPARRRKPNARRYRDPAAKREYERHRYQTDAVARAKKRVRSMRQDFRRYQWAIMWELALPRMIAKVRREMEAAKK